MTRTHCRSCGDETDDGAQCWVCVMDGRPIPAPLVESVVTDADWDAYHGDELDAPCGPTDDDRRLAEEDNELAIILGTDERDETGELREVA